MRRVLPFLPPALLVLVAAVQLGLAHTTPLTQWKLGGFGMFSTSDAPAARAFRVVVEGEAGAYAVPGNRGPARTLIWPREAVLREAARDAVCARWRLVPGDSLDGLTFPSAGWPAFYRATTVRRQTDVDGVAIRAGRGEPGAAIETARATVIHMRLDARADTSRLVPRVVAEVEVPRTACAFL